MPRTLATAATGPVPSSLRPAVAARATVATGAAVGGASAPAGAGTVTGGEIPAGSTVFFGSAYDATTFAVADKTGKIKQGATVVAVGKALAPVDGTGVKLKLEAGGQARPTRAPDAIDNPASATFFASNLTGDNLTPGTWIVSFVNPPGRVLASGFLSVSP